MKKTIFFSIAFCLFSLAGGQVFAQKMNDVQGVKADSVGYIVRVGDIAPDFTVTLTDGTQVTLSALRGKVVMLQFTASWCGVCRKEMPFIERDIWQRHKGDGNFVLVGIDRDEPLDKVIGFAKSVGITYPLGLDPGADIYAKYALRDSGITRNVLIDSTGRIVKLTRLYNEPEFNSLVQKIDAMLME
ncbi:TlpA disulfide reductase family protein [uncultured Bacteroides sp.]|uniref:TlpA family protein disulfide reductase n=1 Tax=uncultured Bacteroides sp. TaxID=162156 RepID=UPI002AABF715|nr:TlpA disulfide reductase family protein [uncultured Bacteroides sp.]